MFLCLFILIQLIKLLSEFDVYIYVCKKLYCYQNYDPELEFCSNKVDETIGSTTCMVTMPSTDYGLRIRLFSLSG